MIQKFLFILILLNPLILFAQKDSVENALLWKITGTDVKKASYIFGTIHVVPQSDFFFNEKMKGIFTSTKELIMETDMDISPEIQLQMMQNMMLPEGKSLSDYMEKKDYDKYMIYLKDSLKISALNMFLLPKIKPLFSFSLILQEKLEHPVSYEMYFQKLAKQNKMNISGLESLQEQMDIINSIPIQEQINLLSDSSNYETDVMKGYYEMLEIYKSQQINKLHDLANDEKLIQKYSARLINNRNKYWLSLIEEKVKQHPCFIAVGAGHLAGADGLITLLRKMGYRLEPVEINQ